ncbi:MAG: polysaccharide deacetylase family protein [Christensenellales bacterium]|jgi:peptidoglycan/xylan/chitin deacetylase (PgdA/CDA1 family)|nr:polysaccharide deacetylase family protein [Clostridiales bacterium]
MKRFFVILMALLCLTFSGQAREKLLTLYLHGDENENRIAVTIDDWYEPERLAEFLDAAKEYNCKLTLYPVGEILKEKDRDLWLRVLAEGHEIGNHSNTHKNLSKASRDSIIRQLTNFEKNLNKALGQEYVVNTLRYPYGAGRKSGTRGAFARAIRDAGYMHVVLWNIDSTDPDTIMRQVGNGSIILLHGNKKDLRAFREILPRLQEKGYEMVTVSELLGLTKTSPDPAAPTASPVP